MTSRVPPRALAPRPRVRSRMSSSTLVSPSVPSEPLPSKVGTSTARRRSALRQRRWRVESEEKSSASDSTVGITAGVDTAGRFIDCGTPLVLMATQGIGRESAKRE